MLQVQLGRAHSLMVRQIATELGFKAGSAGQEGRVTQPVCVGKVWCRPNNELSVYSISKAFSDTPIKLSLLPILPYTQLQILAHLSRPSSQLSSTLGRTRYFLLLLWPLTGPPACLPQAGLSGNPPEQGWPSSSVPPTATREEPLLTIVLSAPSLPSSSR